MAESWDEIWLRKGRSASEDLRELDGFENTDIDHASVAAAIIDALGMKPGCRFLEVACGAGALAKELLAQLPGSRYVGTDRSSSLVAKQITILKTSVLNMSADEPVFTDMFFDFVICYGAFHYFPSHDYAREATRQLLRQARLGVFIGDLPVESHDATHLLYGDAELVHTLSYATPDAWSCERTPGYYNPARFNLTLLRRNNAE